MPGEVGSKGGAEVSGRPALQRVDRHRLVDQAYDAIRQSIVEGGLRPGERLVETQLASALDMSRAPIREAIQRLGKEGLVAEHPHRGACVVSLTAEDVVNIYNLRLGLEVTALRLFMANDADTKPLWDRIDDMRTAAGHSDMTQVVRAELDFHRTIVDSAANAPLAKVFSELESLLQLVLTIDDATFPNLSDIAEEHVPVVNAIEGRDVSQAVRVFEQHLLASVSEAITRLGGSSSALLTPVYGSNDT